MAYDPGQNEAGAAGEMQERAAGEWGKNSRLSFILPRRIEKGFLEEVAVCSVAQVL